MRVIIKIYQYLLLTVLPSSEIVLLLLEYAVGPYNKNAVNAKENITMELNIIYNNIYVQINNIVLFYVKNNPRSF